MHGSFLKNILCVNSGTPNWAVQSETNRTSIVPLILKRMVRYWDHVTEFPSPI